MKVTNSVWWIQTAGAVVQTYTLKQSVFLSSGSAYPTDDTGALYKGWDRIKNLLGLPSLWNFDEELYQ